MDCNTLQDTATHCCNILQHTESYPNTPYHPSTHCNTLQHTATQYNHTATQCNTIQHNTTHCRCTPVCLLEQSMRDALSDICFAQHTTSPCNTLQHPATQCRCTNYACWSNVWETRLLALPLRNTLHHTVLCWYCNTLQHTASHCITLQHPASPCNTL